MTPEFLYKNIDDYCKANSNPAIVQKYSRYFKDGYDAFGLNHDQISSKVTSVLALPEANLELIISTGRLLIAGGKYEEVYMAALLLLSFSKQFDKKVFQEVGHWFDTGIHNWAHTDFICGDLMQVFFNKGIIRYKDLDKWRTAKNKFKRRAVPVTLIKQLKTTTDFQPFIDFIEPMMTDPEREVHQGLGWFLREAWKKQPVLVEAFLLKWKNTAPRLIFQYATEKMSPEEKQGFRKEK